MPDLTQYDMGQLGVNVDSSPIHKLDGELARAQNAIRNPLGVDGGITNRGGFSNLNGTATGASILGGVAVPLGNGPAIAVDTGGLHLSSYDGVSAASSVWVRTRNAFSTAVAVTVPGDTSGVRSIWGTGITFPAGESPLTGVEYLGRIYYPGGVYTVGTESVPIRVFDGTVDYELARIQPTTTLGVLYMAVCQGTIYITTLDSGSTDANWVGRVFSLNPDNGALTQIGPALTTGYLPTAVAMFNNDLFVAGSKQTTTSEAHIFKIRPGVDAAWTDDETLAADQFNVTGMYAWNGFLYFSVYAADGVAPKIVRRNLAGTYSTVKTFTAGVGTTAGSGNFALFLDHLYTSFFDGVTDDGVWRSADGTTWTKVATNAPLGGNMFATQTAVYVFAGPNFSKSTNGTTFSTSASWATLAGISANFNLVVGVIPATAEAT